jgi:hypothetical protein
LPKYTSSLLEGNTVPAGNTEGQVVVKQIINTYQEQWFMIISVSAAPRVAKRHIITRTTEA